MYGLTIICFMLFQTSLSQELEVGDSLIKKGIFYLEVGDHEKSLKILDEALLLASENGWTKVEFLALNNIGVNYYSLLNYGDALDFYSRAYKIALAQLDFNYEMIVLNNIALLYLSDGEYTKAAEYEERAFKIASDRKNKKKVALYGTNLGLIYNKLGKLKQAQKLFDSIENIAIDDTTIKMVAKIGLAEIYFLEGNFISSIDYLKMLLKTIGVGEDFKAKKNSIYILLSKNYFNLQKYPYAIQYAELAVATATDLDSKIEAYELLSILHTKQRDFEKALSYKDSLLYFNDTLHIIKKEKHFENNKIVFELNKTRQDAAHNLIELQKQQRINILILGGGVLLVLILLWGFKNSHLKNKHKRLQAIKEKEMAELELKSQEAEKLLLKQHLSEKDKKLNREQTLLHNEIAMKNRKLSSKALYACEQNEIIKTVIKELQDAEDTRDLKIIKNVRKRLVNLVSPDAGWDDFVKHFESVNQGYLEKLKTRHPSLNTNDLRFISYLYMNISQKEIATILSISPDACRKRKERISKKLELRDGTELYDYLYKI